MNVSPINSTSNYNRPQFGNKIIIKPSENKEITYLYNYCLDIINKEKVGCIFRNEFIEIARSKKSIIEKLKELDITFKEVFTREN